MGLMFSLCRRGGEGGAEYGRKRGRNHSYGHYMVFSFRCLGAVLVLNVYPMNSKGVSSDLNTLICSKQEGANRAT